MSTYVDTDCHIRWMIRRDLLEVLRIEKEAFASAWTEPEFIRVLRQRNVVPFIAEVCERVAGYVIYEFHPTHLHVVNFAVRADCRRRSIGSLLLNRLKSKLSEGRRTRIITYVRESNLPAQKFFAANGFLAECVVHDFYEDTTEDAYMFCYRHGGRECKGKK